jgi:hypothetical protein
MGHWEQTWTGGWIKASSSRLFWLKHVLPQILPSCRIISYDCADLYRDLSEGEVDGIRLDLMNNRRNCNRSQVPIIFLGAGFGGTFIKQLFVSSSPQRNQRAEVRQFHASIRGFAFFSTPQGAQALPDKLKMLHFAIAMGILPRAKELNAIIQRTPSINYDFRSLWGERIPSVCFYDMVNLPMYGQVRFILNYKLNPQLIMIIKAPCKYVNCYYDIQRF